MNQRLNELHLRRGRLLERIASQRAALAWEAQPLHQALDTTDRVVERVRAGVFYIKTHPGIVLLAFAAFFIIKPTRAWRWSTRAYSVWQTWRIMRDRFVIPGL